jgi:hypothetical protein
VIVIALLVPVVLLLMAFALDALENLLFPPPPLPPLESSIPEQSVPIADRGQQSEADPEHWRE